MKKIIFSIISFLFILSMTGCSQIAQLNDRLIVQGIGVDYEKNKYEVTLQVLNVKNKGESSQKVPKEVEIVKNSGKTVTEAIAKIKEKNGKDPLFAQTLLIVIGSNAAKNGLKNFIDFFTRDYEFSPLIEVLIAENKASDILSLEKNEETMSAENIVAVSKLSSNKSKGFNSNIGNIVSDLKNEFLQAKALFVSITENSDEKELNINKLATFKDDKIYNVLDEELTKGFLLIRARTKGVPDVVFSDELSNITYYIIKSKSDINISEKNNKLKISIPIKVEIKILETDRDINKNDYNKIKDLVKNRLKSMAEKSIKKAIIEDETDIFGFSSVYLRRNLIYEGKSPSNLKELLKNADFEIDIKVTIESDK